MRFVEEVIEMASMNFIAGRLLCGRIRNFLDRCKFEGIQIDYIESKGWFNREFTIKGSAQNIVQINACIEKWAKDNDLEEVIK